MATSQATRETIEKVMAAVLEEGSLMWNSCVECSVSAIWKGLLTTQRTSGIGS